MRMIPIEFLVPPAYQQWRPVVSDGLQYIFTHLSEQRLEGKIIEQAALPIDTPVEVRLIRLISKMPGLQKVGQVLARNRRLSPALRNALRTLENGISDVAVEEIRSIIAEQLHTRLRRYSVNVEQKLLSEASVSAVIRFSWKDPGRERELGVFKVLKPFVPACFAEDMRLLERVGGHLAGRDKRYEFGISEIKDMLAEARLLLEHELDFAGEQQTLLDARRMYGTSIGIRVPGVIRPLCTPTITAMTEETGIKVTDAYPNYPIRRSRIAEQLIEALLAVPLLTRRDTAVFHADPHAGNLFYDEPTRELVVLDWALAQRLSLESRRQLVLLAVMMMLRNQEGVVEALYALSRSAAGRHRGHRRTIVQLTERFFRQLPRGYAPGTVDAMHLLDQVALHGVTFPPPLFMFRKIVFTLDGVLKDIAGDQVRIDTVIARAYLTRWLASFGMFHAPLQWKDLAGIAAKLLLK